MKDGKNEDKTYLKNKILEGLKIVPEVAADDISKVLDTLEVHKHGLMKKLAAATAILSGTSPGCEVNPLKPFGISLHLIAYHLDSHGDHRLDYQHFSKVLQMNSSDLENLSGVLRIKEEFNRMCEAIHKNDVKRWASEFQNNGLLSSKFRDNLDNFKDQTLQGVFFKTYSTKCAFDLNALIGIYEDITSSRSLYMVIMAGYYINTDFFRNNRDVFLNSVCSELELYSQDLNNISEVILKTYPFFHAVRGLSMQGVINHLKPVYIPGKQLFGPEKKFGPDEFMRKFTLKENEEFVLITQQLENSPEAAWREDKHTGRLIQGSLFEDKWIGGRLETIFKDGVATGYVRYREYRDGIKQTKRTIIFKNYKWNVTPEFLQADDSTSPFSIVQENESSYAMNPDILNSYDNGNSYSVSNQIINSTTIDNFNNSQNILANGVDDTLVTNSKVEVNRNYVNENGVMNRHDTTERMLMMLKSIDDKVNHLNNNLFGDGKVLQTKEQTLILTHNQVTDVNHFVQQKSLDVPTDNQSIVNTDFHKPVENVSIQLNIRENKNEEVPVRNVWRENHNAYKENTVPAYKGNTVTKRNSYSSHASVEDTLSNYPVMIPQIFQTQEMKANEMETPASKHPYPSDKSKFQDEDLNSWTNEKFHNARNLFSNQTDSKMRTTDMKNSAADIGDRNLNQINRVNDMNRSERYSSNTKKPSNQTIVIDKKDVPNGYFPPTNVKRSNRALATRINAGKNANVNAQESPKIMINGSGFNSEETSNENWWIKNAESNHEVDASNDSGSPPAPTTKGGFQSKILQKFHTKPRNNWENVQERRQLRQGNVPRMRSIDMSKYNLGNTRDTMVHNEKLTQRTEKNYTAAQQPHRFSRQSQDSISSVPQSQTSSHSPRLQNDFPWINPQSPPEAMTRAKPISNGFHMTRGQQHEAEQYQRKPVLNRYPQHQTNKSQSAQRMRSPATSPKVSRSNPKQGKIVIVSEFDIGAKQGSIKIQAPDEGSRKQIMAAVRDENLNLRVDEIPKIFNNVMNVCQDIDNATLC